jgi:uncharacterized protein YqgV (UPF0045/DUF77 family)
MRITAELSLYPLERDFLPRIEAAIRQLRTAPGIEVRVNQMSTQIRGELDHVVRAIESMLAASFADGAPQSLVVKFLNADLPIGDAPDV